MCFYCRVLWHNGKCNPKVGVKGIIEQHMYMDVEAIIGPACSRGQSPTICAYMHIGLLTLYYTLRFLYLALA